MLSVTEGAGQHAAGVEPYAGLRKSNVEKMFKHVRRCFKMLRRCLRFQNVKVFEIVEVCINRYAYGVVLCLSIQT